MLDTIRAAFESLRAKWQTGQGQLDTAIRSLAMVSFLTTAAGIISTSPGFMAAPLSALLTVCVAVFFAAGVALGITAMACMLFSRFSMVVLAGMLVLSTAAVLFDTAFFQAQYAAWLDATVRGPHELTRRRSEYDRLVRDFSAAMAQARTRLQPDLIALKKQREESRAVILWETEQRLPVSARYCGPECKKHQRLVARYNAAMTSLEDLQRLIDTAPVAPASDAWEDLRAFHAAGTGIVRQTPDAWNIAVPTTPTQLPLVTEGGMLASSGGIGVVVEMIGNREFDNPKLLVPLILAMLCEYLVIILVLSARPWRQFRVWLPEAMDAIEACVTRMPAIKPYLQRLFQEAFVADSPDAVARREHSLKLSLLRAEQASVASAMADIRSDPSLFSRHNGLYRNGHGDDHNPQKEGEANDQ